MALRMKARGNEGQAVLLPKHEARTIYDNLVRQIRDPALLEFVGYNLIRSSVFPVQANGTQWVRLTYEHVLKSDGTRIDYVLPRSEMLDYDVPWKVSLSIRHDNGVAAVYSATHEVVQNVITSHEVHAAFAPGAQTIPGAFCLSYLTGSHALTASMLCYPDPKINGGYFLLLAGVPADEGNEGGSYIQREITLGY